MEEAKPQRDPQTASSPFLKSHLQLSVKFRDFSQCLGQLRVRASRWAQWAPWNSPSMARAGGDCWTDTNGYTRAQPSSWLPALTHSQPGHPARGDCTECPQLQQKYGNYTGREGIPGSSRLKNNSQFINARGNSSHEQGLSEKALKQGGQCLGLPKCRKRLGSCRNLSCFVQPHTMLFPYNIKALQKLTGQSHFLTGKYSGIQATRKWERKNIIITL